jgi:hypothetical protein
MNLEELQYWNWEELEEAIASIPDDQRLPYGIEQQRQRLLAERRYRLRRNYTGPAQRTALRIDATHNLNPKTLGA